MKRLRLFAVPGPLITGAIHLHALVVLWLQRHRVSQWPLGRKDSYLPGLPRVTLLSPVSVPSKVSVAVSKSRRHFPYRSFATSDRSTLVDQPTIMLRNVSHPSAKTRITCGTTKRM